MFDTHFSKRAKALRASDVRELLKLLQAPDMISFAGGLPNPETFPTEIIRDIANDVLKDDGARALQYGITEGYLPLREAIADRMSRHGTDAATDDIGVVSGSQQVIDLIGKVLIDPHDAIVISAPTYLTALTGFAVYDARFESVPIDEENMRIDLFEDKLKSLATESVHPKLVYALPNFQNPAGVTMPEKSRRRLVDLASEHNLIILEDDPYGELRYRGDDIRSIKSFDDEGRVVYMSTFSKILAPGLRVGWMAAHPDLLRKLIIAKQSSDVCTNVLGQVVAQEYITRGHIDTQIQKIREIYGRKLNIMLEGMDRFMPDSVAWIRPDGGMFLWATLPEGVSSGELLSKALERRVAFVSGRAFFPDPADGMSTLRLNFTHPSDEMITEGLRRLGGVFKEEMDPS
ncbi:MAG: PLP-dependent aminotransferase family protein [Methanobacteriota archaeon]|nr:MAG: PLP-dependent aminotransferase family protein [Euryarchaeota archaeon]